MVLELLQDMLLNGHLIAAEHKAAVAIIKQLETNVVEANNEELRMILHPTQVQKRKSILHDMIFLLKAVDITFEQIAVSDIAEQMALIDHKLFCALNSE